MFEKGLSCGAGRLRDENDNRMPWGNDWDKSDPSYPRVKVRASLCPSGVALTLAVVHC